MAYSEKVPTMSAIRDVRTFDKHEPGVGAGIVGVGAPDCGDVMKLQINTIVDTNFKIFGCGPAIAV